MLLSGLILSSPAVHATAPQIVLIFHSHNPSAPQMHPLNFCVTLPAISFILHPHGFISAEFLSVKLVLLEKSHFGFIKVGRFY